MSVAVELRRGVGRAEYRQRHRPVLRVMSARFPAPPSLVEALVSTDRALADAAYAELRRWVHRSRHPAVRAASAAQRDEIVQEVAVLLTREPAVAAAASVHTWVGLGTAIHRWIDQCRGDSIEDRATAYREHLWKKLRTVLGDTSRYVRVTAGSVTGFVRVGAPVTEGLPVSVIVAHLDARRPKVFANRDDQIGEILTVAELGALVDEVFARGGNTPRSRNTLTSIALRVLGLESGPAVSRYDELAPPGHTASETPAPLRERDAWRMAEALLASLDARTRQAAALRFGDPPYTLEAVAQALGVSRGTAENEVGATNGRFGAALRAWAAGEGLDDEERERLLAAVLARLGEETR